MLYNSIEGVRSVYEVAISLITYRIMFENNFKESYAFRYDTEIHKVFQMLTVFNDDAKQVFTIEVLEDILMKVAEDYNLSVHFFYKLNKTIKR